MGADVESQPSPQPAAPVEPVWSLWIALGMFAFWMALNLTIPQTSLMISLALHRIDASQWESEAQKLVDMPWTAFVMLLCTLLCWIITFGVLDSWFRRFPRELVRKALAVRIPRPRWSLVAAALIGVGVYFAALAIQNVSPDTDVGPFEDLLKSTVGKVSLTLLAVGLAPFAEEIFFRGFLYPPMLAVASKIPGGSRGRSIAIACFANALLFTIAHTLDYGLDFASLAGVMLLGLAAALLRAWSGSVWPGIVGHLFFNGTALVIAFAFGGSP